MRTPSRDAPRRAALALSLILAAAPSLLAAGTIAAEFLRFGVGPTAGMGEASASLVEDSTALYWNPAGLAALTNVDIYASHDSLPMTLRHDFLSIAVPFGRWGLPGVVGYSIQALTQSSIASLDNTGNSAGSYTATDMAQTFGWAYGWEEIRLGAAVRYIHQSLADVSGSATAVDLGAQKDIGQYWTLGAGVANLGSDIKLGSQAAPLPRTERAGAGLRLFGGDLLFAGDASNIQGQGVRGHLGVQYRLYPPSTASIPTPQNGSVSVRGGYTFPKTQDDAYSGAAYGISLGFRSFRADFSYQPFGDLGNSLQFGLGYRF